MLLTIRCENSFRQKIYILWGVIILSFVLSTFGRPFPHNKAWNTVPLQSYSSSSFMVRKKKNMIEVLFLFFIFSINKFAIFAEVLAPIHNENEKQKSIVS